MNPEGKDALVSILLYGSPNANNHEVITKLLYSEPRILVCYEEYCVFQWTFINRRLISVQELLMHSTLNDDQSNKMHLNILVQFEKDGDIISKANEDLMANFFEEEEGRYVISDYVEMMLTNVMREIEHYYLLFSIDVNYLRSLLEGCNPDVYDLCKIVFNGNHICYFSYDDKLSRNQVITYLELFLESGPKMNNFVIEFISELNWRLIFDMVKKHGEEATRELFLLLIRNGLRLETPIYDAVRNEFGYCELFKILLHMDVVKTRTYSSETSIMTSLIIDVYSDLEDYLDKDYLVPGIGEVMDYFAHPKLTKYLRKYSHMLPEKYKSKFVHHPTIPRLEEIARNVLRRYLAVHFQIDTKKKFYTLVNSLPISNYKKIITFETKLY